MVLKKFWYTTAFLTASLLLASAALLLLPGAAQARYSGSAETISTYVPPQAVSSFDSDLLSVAGEDYLLYWNAQPKEKTISFLVTFPEEQIPQNNSDPSRYAEKDLRVRCTLSTLSENCISATATNSSGDATQYPADYVIPADGQAHRIYVNLSYLPEKLQSPEEVLLSLTATCGEDALTARIHVQLLPEANMVRGSMTPADPMLFTQTSYDPTQPLSAVFALPARCVRAKLRAGDAGFPEKTRFSFDGTQWYRLLEASSIDIPTTAQRILLDLSETVWSTKTDALTLCLDAVTEEVAAEETPQYQEISQRAEISYVQWSGLWQGSYVMNAAVPRVLPLPENGLTASVSVEMLTPYTAPVPEEASPNALVAPEQAEPAAVEEDPFVWQAVAAETITVEKKEVPVSSQEPQLAEPATMEVLSMDAKKAAAGTYRLVITWTLGDKLAREEYIPFFVVK